MMRSNKSRNTKRANWKRNLVWSVVTMVIMGVLFMAIERKKEATVSKVGISIKGIKGGRSLVTKKGVKTMFRNYLGYDLEASTIGELDLMDMEAMLEADERIKEAEVFVDKNDRLYIAIRQREPIVRIFSKNKKSYYLDMDGQEIPAYRNSTIRVPVASGNLGAYDSDFLKKNKKSTLLDVFTIAKYIHEDEFLSALIEQINVEDSGEVTMVPKVGRQKLAFGFVENEEAMKDRFEKVKQMYKEGMKHLGWRKHDVLTLQYDTKSKGKNGESLHLIFGTKREKKN